MSSRVPAEGASEWQGAIELRLLQRGLPSDSPAQRVVKNAGGGVASTSFVTGTDGVLRFEYEWGAHGANAFVVRGERISRDVIDCDW